MKDENESDKDLFEIKDGELIFFKARKESGRKLEIPDGARFIGRSAFGGTAIEKISIPKSVEYIEPKAFEGMYGLREIDVDEENAAYVSEDGCLYSRDKKILVCVRKDAENFDVPEGVTTIGDCAFDGCKSLKSVRLPDGLTLIGEEAFLNCENLSSVRLPETVRSIGECAFYGCKSLASVSLPKSLKYMGLCAFAGCEKIESATVPGGVKVLKASAFAGCASLKKVVIEEGVRYLDACVFARSGIESLCLPSSLSDMFWDAFDDAEKLREILVDEKSEAYVVSDGVLYTRDKKMLVIACRDIEELDVPEGVETIEPFAFDGCERLSRLTLPETVVSIFQCAFRLCDALKELTVPASVKEADLRGNFDGACGIESLRFEDPFGWSCRIEFDDDDWDALGPDEDTYDRYKTEDMDPEIMGDPRGLLKVFEGREEMYFLEKKDGGTR